MAVPFEDPEKTDLRERSATALERAGFEVRTTPTAINLPDGVDLKGGIKGDVQGVSTEDVVACLYVVPSPGDAVPKWIANLGPAAHALSDIEVYVVVREYSAKFETSCHAAGLGLLVLNDDDELDSIINFNDASPLNLDDEIKQLDGEARRALETKVDLTRAELLQRRNDLVRYTSGMPTADANGYVRGVERAYAMWGEWSESISSALDAAFAQRDAEALKRLREEIEAGPDIPEVPDDNDD